MDAHLNLIVAMLVECDRREGGRIRNHFFTSVISLLSRFAQDPIVTPSSCQMSGPLIAKKIDAQSAKC